MAHPPTAMTYLGSAIWSYKRFSTGAILCVIVPATMIISAWRELARATSNPKRAKSYRAAPTAINSIPQQLVANVSGHNELQRKVKLEKFFGGVNRKENEPQNPEQA